MGGRGAPPVTLEVGVPPAWRGLHAVPLALATAAFGAWVLGHLAQPVGWSLLLLAPAGYLGWRLPGDGRHVLHWDGQGWHLDGRPTLLTVRADLGPLMVVQCRDPDRRHTRWLAVARADGGTAWPAWRSAVYCRRPEPPPAARPR